MRVLFVGSKDRGVRCLEALLEAGIEIVGVVTTPDSDPDAFWDGSVERAADEHGLDVYTPQDINDPAFVETVRDHTPDLITMSGYNQVLGPAILDVPPEGVINLHAGKLPAYRGGSPMNWALIRGASEITLSIHFATEAIDAGDVIAEEAIEVAIDDTIADVRNESLDRFPGMLVDVVEAIAAGDVEGRGNDPTEGAYWGSRAPQDGRIRWSDMSAREVYDFVRALTHPYPGAFTTYNDDRLYVWDATLLDEEIRHAPGRVCMKRGEGRVVAARDRGVLVERVAVGDGPEQPAAEVLEKGVYLG